MRLLRVVVILALVTVSGCIPGGEECNMRGKTTEMEMLNAPPGTVLTLALAGCSTCDHSRAEGFWTTEEVDGTTTGNVEVQLSPQCFVRDMTSEVPPNIGYGLADNNYKNCGDVIDYAAYLTNRSNVAFDSMRLTLQCPTLE